MLSKVDRRLALLAFALALTCLAGWLFKAHCTPGGWTDHEQYSTGCYSDAVPFWTAREIDKGKIPYFQTRMEYPVLTGAAIWIEGAATRAILGHGANSAHFLAAVTLGNALLAFLVLWMLWRAGLDERRLWGWAVAPPLILYLGHNWDMVAVALAVAAMLLARRNRLVAAAAIAALGAAAKLWPALLLPMLGLRALFEGRRSWSARLVRAALVTAVAIGAWVAVNLPVALGNFENWSEFYRFSGERGGTAAATWEVLGNNGWISMGIEARNRYAAALFLIGAAAIIGIGWRRHAQHLWVLFTPVLAWFLLTNKVWSPQFDLWLYPLLLMTAPRLLPILLFVIADIAAYFAEFWFFAAIEAQGAPPSDSAITIAWAIRAAAMLWLIADALQRDPPAWVTRLTSPPA